MNISIIEILNNTLYIFGVEILNGVILFKIALAIAIGKIIGKERKRNAKPGGARTFAIVCLGATLIAILSQELTTMQGTSEILRYNFARLMSYGIGSIGFLGAGIIMHQNNKIEGLTTASTLWVIVPIGFLIGLSFYSIAICASIFIYLILESKYKIPVKRRKKCYTTKTK